MSDAHVIHASTGTITIPAGVLTQIVRRAAEEAEGARVRKPRKSVAVEVGKGGAVVAVELNVRYGAVVPDVAEEVQRRVADALRAMCGLEAETVDVRVEELDG
jgi:uncharacterized alkaline shock family protein YloU